MPASEGVDAWLAGSASSRLARGTRPPRSSRRKRRSRASSSSRDGRIRTGGLLLPKQARYQAALRPAPPKCRAPTARITSAAVVDAPLNVPERSEDPTSHRRPALGYALVLAAIALWSVNATVAKIVVDSGGLSALRLAEVRGTRRRDPPLRGRGDLRAAHASRHAPGARLPRHLRDLRARLRPLLLLHGDHAPRHRDRARHPVPRPRAGRALGALLRPRARTTEALVRARAGLRRAHARRRDLERRRDARRRWSCRGARRRLRLCPLHPHGRAQRARRARRLLAPRVGLPLRRALLGGGATVVELPGRCADERRLAPRPAGGREPPGLAL